MTKVFSKPLCFTFITCSSLGFVSFTDSCDSDVFKVFSSSEVKTSNNVRLYNVCLCLSQGLHMVLVFLLSLIRFQQLSYQQSMKVHQPLYKAVWLATNNTDNVSHPTDRSSINHIPRLQQIAHIQNPLVDTIVWFLWNVFVKGKLCELRDSAGRWLGFAYMCQDVLHWCKDYEIVKETHSVCDSVASE